MYFVYFIHLFYSWSLMYTIEQNKQGNKHKAFILQENRCLYFEVAPATTIKLWW